MSVTLGPMPVNTGQASGANPVEKEQNEEEKTEELNRKENLMLAERTYVDEHTIKDDILFLDKKINHEKTKKKRGGYKGGAIQVEGSNSFKYDSDFGDSD